MADDAMTGRDMGGQNELDAEATARLIDALMAEPPAGLPAIVVVGDDAVFGIRPAKRPA